MDKHWTERDVKDFLYKIAADFIDKLEERMELMSISQEELAKKLKVSKGRVSQIINNPGNITLKKIIEYSRALGLKVSILAYDDGDPNNKKGPIDAEIFHHCWEKCGMPKNYWELRDRKIDVYVLNLPLPKHYPYLDISDQSPDISNYFQRANQETTNRKISTLSILNC